jgi:hypothetical protein
MTMAEFVAAVSHGMYNEYDGSGCWATPITYDENSEVFQSLRNPPEWATHVAWFAQ